MADHVYSGEIVRRLLAAPRSPDELLLAVDRRARGAPDLDDATLVRLDAHDRIIDIGKGLARHDAVDTGVFLADTALFRALEQEKEIRGGDCSLSDGVRRLARAGLARGVDVGDSWWHDVDTRADLARAERWLFGLP
jgi:choline kinase